MTVMLRPTPSTIADTGYCASSRAPAKKSDSRGPGTLEITRLSGGRVRPSTSMVVRAASAITAGGMKLVASVNRSAGSARWRSLALRSSSWVRRSRSAGSGSSVGIGTTIVEMRLPNVPFSSARRTETGTIATSGSRGSSSRSSSQVRSAPAHKATTTSFTVTPTWLLIAFTVSSDSEPSANRRWAEMGPLKLVRGGRAVVTSSTEGSSSEPSARRACPSAELSCGPPGKALAPGRSVRFGRVLGSARRARTGWRGSPARPRPSISRSPGTRSPDDRGGGGGSSRPSGLGSRSAERISLPDTPSTTAWWILVSSAARPPWSPWMR